MYRTETKICVGCGLEIKYRIKISNPKWSGNFNMGIGSRFCPRCQTIAGLAKEGDKYCQELVNKRAAAYA